MLLLLLFISPFLFSADWSELSGLHGDGWQSYLQTHPGFIQSFYSLNGENIPVLHDFNFYSGLQEIIESRDLEKLQLLLGAGLPASLVPDENLKEEYSALPLFLSIIRSNWQEGTILFLEYGAPVNQQTELGQNPLYYTVRNNNAELTELLLKNGATCEIRIEAGHRDRGLDPYQIALRNDNQEILSMLEKYNQLTANRHLVLEAKVGTATADIYAAPDFDSDKIRTIPRDTSFNTLLRSPLPEYHEGETCYWFFVETEEIKGWVFGKSVRFKISIFSVFD